LELYCYRLIRFDHANANILVALVVMTIRKELSHYIA
jgi:hypothetical protein